MVNLNKLLNVSRMKKVEKLKFDVKPQTLASPIGLEGTCFQGKIHRSSEIGEHRGKLNDFCVTEIITIFVSRYKAKSVSVIHPT